MIAAGIRAYPRGAATDGSKSYVSEELRSFLEDRLRLFAKTGFFFLLADYVLTNSARVLEGAQELDEFVTSARSALVLLNLATFGAVWVLCRRGGHAWPALKTMDVTLVTLFCWAVGWNVWNHGEEPFVYVAAALPVTFATLARAVIVPSSPLRTAWISAAAYAPLPVVAYAVRDGAVQTRATPDVLSFSVDCLLGIALATVASGVLFRLRHQMHRVQQLGQYKLQERIGSGAMGEVYRASHAMLRRPTAIKVLRQDLAGERDLLRFEREVQLTSQLTHPNTVAIYDYGRTPDGTLYYAMEYLDGLTLKRLVEFHGPQPPGRVIHILRQICGSLVEAHAAGLVHRDIKPANVILCERGHVHDFVKLVDFGLVKSVTPESSSRLTTANAVTGTPLYMSPEAIRAPRTMDARSDLYALGVVGYYLLTGTTLFESENVMEVCAMQLSRVPEPPSSRLGRALADDLERLILKTLEKDMDARPQSALEFGAALAACRDAHAWTEELATSWWKENAPELRSPGQVEAAQERVATPAGDGSAREATHETPTLTIDFGHRV